MMTMEAKGTLTKIEKMLVNATNANSIIRRKICEKYGRQGVAALASYTPKDTGLTAASWSYSIEDDGNRITIGFDNSNIVDDWCNVAVIIQYGHGTANGGYVAGVDYINPALKPIFDKMADDAWKEVTS